MPNDATLFAIGVGDTTCAIHNYLWARQMELVMLDRIF